MFLSFIASFSLSVFVLPHEEKSFVSWMRSTNQFFTGNDYQLRFGIYMSNARLVQEHNAHKSFKLSLNKFAAYTPAEYSALLGFRQEHSEKSSPSSPINTAVTGDEEVDWRKKNVVEPIRDQGQCGSCWAFSAIQGCESAFAITTNTLLKFSEQNLVDCVTKCNGCNGGLMTTAIDYVIRMQNGMFSAETDYPYKAVAGKCKFTYAPPIGKVTGYLNVIKYSETDLAMMIAQNGPACVAIDASHYTFQLYSYGIYDEKSCSSTSLDHGVGCVGYGTYDDVAYWIVRNSWGESWGEDGYIRMIKDKNNQCGIATMAIIPKYDR